MLYNNNLDILPGTESRKYSVTQEVTLQDIEKLRDAEDNLEYTALDLDRLEVAYESILRATDTANHIYDTTKDEKLAIVVGREGLRVALSNIGQEGLTDSIVTVGTESIAVGTESISDIASTVWKKMKELGSKIWEMIMKLVNGIKNYFNKTVSFVIGDTENLTAESSVSSSSIDVNSKLLGLRKCIINIEKAASKNRNLKTGVEFSKKASEKLAKADPMFALLIKEKNYKGYISAYSKYLYSTVRTKKHIGNLLNYNMLISSLTDSLMEYVKDTSKKLEDIGSNDIANSISEILGSLNVKAGNVVYRTGEDIFKILDAQDALKANVGKLKEYYVVVDLIALTHKDATFAYTSIHGDNIELLGKESINKKLEGLSKAKTGKFTVSVTDRSSKFDIGGLAKALKPLDLAGCRKLVKSTKSTISDMDDEIEKINKIVEEGKTKYSDNLATMKVIVSKLGGSEDEARTKKALDYIRDLEKIANANNKAIKDSVIGLSSLIKGSVNANVVGYISESVELFES